MFIGDRLRALREEKKLSQGDIEKKTGLPNVAGADATHKLGGFILQRHFGRRDSRRPPVPLQQES
jgi:transcriptional regulator with XRE-family HTH domain